MTPLEAVNNIKSECTFEKTGNNFLCSEEWQTLEAFVLAQQSTNRQIAATMLVGWADVVLKGTVAYDSLMLFIKESVKIN